MEIVLNPLDWKGLFCTTVLNSCVTVLNEVYFDWICQCSFKFPNQEHWRNSSISVMYKSSLFGEFSPVVFFLTFNTELYLLLTKISQAFACTFYLFLVLLVAVVLLFILSVHWVSFNGPRFLGSEIPDWNTR